MLGAQVVEMLIAVSFAAGLNLYVTVAVLGLLGRFHFAQLPPGLQMLEGTLPIAAASILAAVEAVADKIPYVDLVWNALHTFVRIPAAALLAYEAGSGLSPTERTLVSLAATLIAGAAHLAKTSARVAVSPSPEPITNGLLSTAEDMLAAACAWLATRHPAAACILTVVVVFCAGLLVRSLIRGVRRSWNRLRGLTRYAPQKERSPKYLA